jgi:hypothetical protein
LEVNRIGHKNYLDERLLEILDVNPNLEQRSSDTMPEAISLQASRVFIFSYALIGLMSLTSIKSFRNIANSTSTMKYTLTLLTAMVFDVVFGAQLGAEIQGVTDRGSSCTVEKDRALYKECVEDVAVSMGIVLSRRLELRGNRELVNGCRGCADDQAYPTGHWCFVMCSTRRLLTTTDDQALLTVTDGTTDFYSVEEGNIQRAANACLDLKIEEGCECLGNPEDLKIKIMLFE